MAMSRKEQTDYKRKFNEAKYDRIGMYLPKGSDVSKGMKEVWTEAAAAEGYSLNDFIKHCVNEHINSR